MPIQVSKPVVRVSASLVGYAPQEGWPALSGHSYRAGCLCGLRCPVAPFPLVGPVCPGLPRGTMKRSDSRLSFSQPFLSLGWPSRLALVVSAAGDYRGSMVPNGPFFTRHALRTREGFQRLTWDSAGRLEFP